MSVTAEPDDNCAVVDASGDTWVRYDEMPGQRGPWWPITDGRHWEDWGRNKVGVARAWDDMDEYGPFTPADRGRTARALGMVREELAR